MNSNKTNKDGNVEESDDSALHENKIYNFIYIYIFYLHSRRPLTSRMQSTAER